MEAGFSAYVDYVMKNIRFERDSKKRAIGYEKAINAIEKLGKSEDNEEVEKLLFLLFFILKGGNWSTRLSSLNSRIWS